MKTVLRFLVLALIGSTGSRVLAADPPGFAIWKAGELKAHDAALPAHVAEDHSSRETLADYGTHRFRMLYRDADGNPEQHDAIIDIVYVQSGEGTLVMGGRCRDAVPRRLASTSARVSTAAIYIRSAPATSSTSRPGFPTVFS